MEFMYKQPVEIIFGNGSLQELGKLCERYDGNGLLVCTPHFVKDGTACRLQERNVQLCAVFSSISVNPDVCEVQECCRIILEKRIAFLVVLGGGSAMDLAKAAASIALSGDSVMRYFGTGIPLPPSHLPLIAVPTTAGTGSEVTNVAVLTSRETGKKAPIASDNFYPDVALIDPELTWSVPPKISASCGLDVLSHALEAFWSKHHQPICDALAFAACERVFRNLLQVYQHSDDKKARTEMSEASLLAGLSFAMPKTTAPHACSYPLTNIYGIPHGEACALTLTWFARCNADERLHGFAKKLGFMDAFAMCDAIDALRSTMKMRMNLKDLELSEVQIKDLVILSHHPNLANNPVEITDEMLERLYRSLI